MPVQLLRLLGRAGREDPAEMKAELQRGNVCVSSYLPCTSPIYTHQLGPNKHGCRLTQSTINTSHICPRRDSLLLLPRPAQDKQTLSRLLHTSTLTARNVYTNTQTRMYVYVYVYMELNRGIVTVCILIINDLVVVRASVELEQDTRRNILNLRLDPDGRDV